MNTAFTLQRSSGLDTRRLTLLLSTIFFFSWVFFAITTRSQVNWWLENILVIGFGFWFYFLQKKFQFRQASLICIFLFLWIHIYGAQMSYTYNQLGIWMQEHWQLQRNPYDRIVHFSFGLLMVYPVYDFLLNRMKLPARFGSTFSVIVILALATLFELIEWGVAACTDSETGESYVATQGDVWDAHKDIALALLSSCLVMMGVVWFEMRKSVHSSHFKAWKSSPHQDK